MKKLKQRRGITLVALVITIIILLILAGITLHLTIGKNGILHRAREAGNNYRIAQIDEEKVLDELSQQSDIESLPENTKDIQAGTEVRIPSNWYSKTSAYISTENGSIVKQMLKVATVTAVATGNGEAVPVPQGFYYVGGTINTGVVISDNPSDKNKYVNYTVTGEIKEGIPPGVTYNEDGTVNMENLELKGNQFVWIPVSANEYTKKIWGKNENGKNTWNATWETTTNTAELTQIQKYGGFYVGRYEAGTSNLSLSTGINFANKNTADSWKNDSFSLRDELNHTVSGTITSKAGEIPYYHADYFTAIKLSNTMYQTDYVQSGLVTGTMWDAIMKFIAENNDETVTRSAWGNYTDGAVSYIAGKGRYATVDENTGTMTSAFVKNNGKCGYGIKTTAISEDTKKKNIYDVAGNLMEWTQEAAYCETTSETYMVRGGAFNLSYKEHPACYRGGPDATSSRTNYGFRPVLYIK